MSQLNRDEFRRYSRHILIPEIGIEGQLKLKQSRVLVVGAGGLGVPVLIYLAAAGVGTLGLVEFDTIDYSNLQRQVIYKTKEVGLKKANQAKAFISEQNPEISVTIYPTYIDSSNALDILKNYDLVVDGTDNFPTRYLLNDAAVLTGIPYVYGSIFRFEGQVSVFNQKLEEGFGPNYRDLFPEPPHPDLVPNCSEGGVLGVLPGIVGSLQALEAIKIICGIGETLSGKLLTIDTLSNFYRTFKIKKRSDNPISGEQPTITGLIDYEAFCNPAHYKAEKSKIKSISPIELHQLSIENQEFQLIDVRKPYEYEISNLGGTLIPKDEIETRINEISRDKKVIVHCRSGKRSADVIKLLQDSYGYNNLINLEGGIIAYAEQIDPSLTIY